MLPRRIRYGRLIVVDSKDASSNPDVGNEFQTAGNRTQYNRYSSAIDVDETSHFIAIIAGTFNTLEQVCRKKQFVATTALRKALTAYAQMYDVSW